MTELEFFFFFGGGGGYAREILAKIWSGMIIDGHLVLAEFSSEEADQEVIKKSEE